MVAFAVAVYKYHILVFNGVYYFIDHFGRYCRASETAPAALPQAGTAGGLGAGPDALDELGEGRELRLDDVLGRLILQLERVLVELRLSGADEDFRRAEDEGV